jgi:UPF0271 protein
MGSSLEALVLDTSAILSGFAIHISDTTLFTTPQVLNELQGNKFGSSSQVPLINDASIRVLTPNEESLRRVNEVADSSGEVSLSETDRSLIALALELKDNGYEPILVTDDYALQNSASMMNLRFQPYAEKGITNRYRWRLVCPGCFREYKFSNRIETCPVCGTKLKKKVSTSKKVKKH